LSSVTSVGLASIVTSIATPGRAPNRARIASSAARMQSARHSDGVPPPR